MDKTLKEDIEILKQIVEDSKYCDAPNYVIALKRVIYFLEQSENYLSDMEILDVDAENEIDDILDELDYETGRSLCSNENSIVHGLLKESVAVLGLGDAGMDFLSRNISRGIFPEERCIAISRDGDKLIKCDAGVRICLTHDEESLDNEQKHKESTWFLKTAEETIKETVSRLNCTRIAIVFSAGGAYADGVFTLIRELRMSRTDIIDIYPFGYLPLPNELEEGCKNAKAIYDKLCKEYACFSAVNKEYMDRCARTTAIEGAFDLIDYNMLEKFCGLELI